MNCIQILSVTRDSANAFMNIIRGILWEIAKGVLWLLDGFFSILDSIWRYEFFNNDYVNKIFGGAIIIAGSFLILKVLVELITNHMIKSDGQNSPLTIFRGVIFAIIMMFLISPLFDFGHKVSTEMTNAVITVSDMGKGSTAEGTISKTLVRAMIYKEKMNESDINVLVDNWKTIDINKSEGGLLGIGDEYVYSVNSFMLIVLSVVTVFLLFFVAIQMAKRVMEIALYKIIGPFCCTSLTGNSKAFGTWSKGTLGLFMITVVQFISLGLLLNMFGSAITDNGFFVGIFLMVGALLFIIGTPTIVSSLLGQQSGLMTAFGDIQSMVALGNGVNTGLSLAKSGLTSSASVIPKSAGYTQGVKNMYSSYRNQGNSAITSLTKTTGSQMAKPFVPKINKAIDSIKSSYSSGIASGSSSINFSPHQKSESDIKFGMSQINKKEDK